MTIDEAIEHAAAPMLPDVLAAYQQKATAAKVLAKAVERLRAELVEVDKLACGQVEMLDQEIERLQVIVDTVAAKTADGVPIVAGMTIWLRLKAQPPTRWVVRGPPSTGSVRCDSYTTGEVVCPWPSECFSTRGAAEAAGGGE